MSIDGELVPVRAKTFRLICHFAENMGRVIGKDELMDAIWPGVFVTEDSLTQCIRDARRAIRDDGQSIIRTLPRRGYVMVAPVPDHAESALAASPSATGARPPEPYVAILPFRGRAPRRLTLDAFAEEIGNAVARFRSVAVIAQSSSDRFGGENQDVIRAGKELGADYCLYGVADENSPPTLRLDLVEVATARRVWNEVIPFGDAFVLDGAAGTAVRVVGSLVGSVESAAGRRASLAPSASLQAYGHMVRGIALLRQHGDGVNEAARAELEIARSLDPGSGLIQSYLALAKALIAFHAGACGDLKPARDLAAAACALAPEEARCHRILGIILGFMKEFAAAEARYHKAIELNPYDADTLAQLGYIRSVRGWPEEGLQLMERAIRLNPYHPDWYYSDRFAPLFMLGRFADAARDLERLPHRGPRHAACLAAAYAMMGQAERAVQRFREALEADPALPVEELSEAIEWEKAEHRRLLARGLRRAAEMSANAGRGERTQEISEGFQK